MSQVLTDVRFALRSHGEGSGVEPPDDPAPWRSGLAANGIIFNILDAMVLRGFEFPNSGRLVRSLGDRTRLRRDRPRQRRAGEPARLAGPGRRAPWPR